MSSAIPESPSAIVLGSRRTGMAAAALIDRLGGRCYVADDSSPIVDLPESATAVSVEAAAEHLGEVDLLIPSPGVPAGHPLIRTALRHALPVVAELEFASRFLDSALVAVTGTNGKSTTVSLLAEALRCEGRRVFAGGNLGTPLSSAVGGDFDVCAVEVSSFQLEWVSRFHPQAAALLNLAPDHLDRHTDMRAYAETKLRLFGNMQTGDVVVLGAGESAYAERLRASGATIVGIGERRAGSPFAGGEDEVFYDRRERTISARSWCAQLGEHWPLADYDFANAAAAAALARCQGVSDRSFSKAAQGFTPLPHRLAWAGTVAGVRFWDDSKATNPAATVCSVGAFEERRVVLLAGGLAKGDNLAGLSAVASRVKAVVAFGAAADKVAEACAGARCCERAPSMRAAFEIAVSLARPGDEVLLAPACASFDEFVDYRERGRAFVAMVEGLGGED